MVSFAEGVRNGLRNAYCSQVAGSPQWFSNLRSVLISPGLIQQGDNLNRWVCDTPPDDEPELPDPPFTGGQCPIRYRVFAQQWSNSQGIYLPETQITSNIIGPIAVVSNPEVQPPPGGCPEGSFFNNAFLRDGAGVIRNGLASGCLTNAQGYIGLRVEPFDAVPDNCGDPEPELPPVAPIETDVDITYDGNDSTEYNLTVPVIFAPFYVALDGTLRIPVSIGELNFNGEIGFSPEFNVEITPATEPGGGTPDNPELPPSGSPGLDGGEEPDGPEGTIVGVVVRSTEFGPTRATVLFMEDMPDVLAPRCATVRFLCRFGSLSAWTSDLPVKGVNEYIPCPSPFGAIDVQVTAETNWSTVSTPVRSRPPAVFEP